MANPQTHLSQLQIGNRIVAISIILCCMLGAALGAPIVKHTDSSLVQHRSEHGKAWKLLWKDDFEGSSLNEKKWSYQLYDGCQYNICNWGNGELSWYTNHTRNLRVSRGKLVLEARTDNTPRAAAQVSESCWNDCRNRCRMKNLSGPSYDGCINDCGNGRCQAVKFTSGRVRTFGKFSIAPSERHKTVRIESRMKLPKGAGLWPAFWLLPEVGASPRCSGCGQYGHWPSSGEIDIMEAANNMATVNGTLHFGGGGDHQYITGASLLTPGWHVFAIEWEANEMRWYLDNKLYNRIKSGAAVSPEQRGWFTTSPKARALASSHAPFGNGDTFHIIINLAVGGSFTSTSADVIAQTLATPKRMLVDWVRVLAK